MSVPNTNRKPMETRYNNARANLLLVVILTVINSILLITDSDTYFLFSAFVPYLLLAYGMLFCGMYPSEYYEGGDESLILFEKSGFAVFAAIALLMVAMYFVSWILSRKNRGGWLIFALVIFVIDTVAMALFWSSDPANLIDVAIHIWVIVSLSLGIYAWARLRKMPAEEAEAPQPEEIPEGEEPLADSAILRPADLSVKARALLETQVLGHTVTYRRVKKVNELVIDGNVYAEYEGVVEFDHSLKARVDGHWIEAGFDSRRSISYITLDGQTVTAKRRWF